MTSRDLSAIRARNRFSRPRVPVLGVTNRNLRALVARRWHLGESAAFCERSQRFCLIKLRSLAYKAAQVALTACMRKLLTILNAMVQHHTPWLPEEGLSA